jgi:hypothetical protein
MNNLSTSFTPLKVCGEWTEEVYDCFHNGQHWNGWAMPYFTFEEAMRVAQTMGDMTYDPVKDTFIATNSGEPDDIDVYQAVYINVNGKQVKTYPLGAGSWCWNMVLPSGDLKVYMAYWSKEAFFNELTNQVAQTFFTDGLGYDKDEIEAINALEVGETWQSNDYGSYHTAIRIQ